MDLLSWLFTRWSAWLCVPVALIAFIGINVVLRVLASINPVFKQLPSIGPMFGLTLAGVILLVGIKAGVEKLSRRDLYDRQTSLDSIRDLSWAEFERLIGEAYRRQGYAVTETGGGGPDGGIDLTLTKATETALVQCKQWKVFKVGVKPIRELYGVLMASGANRAVFVTSGVYTNDAKAFAVGKPLELADGDSLAQLIPAIPAKAEPSRPAAEPSTTDSAPACPTCGSSMILRTARRGSNAGSQFWGCSTYPKCRGIRQEMAHMV